MTNTPTFDPIKHGPALWQLQGLKWTAAEAANNSGWLKGKSAEYLASVLGLELDAVTAIIDPPPASRGPLGRVADFLERYTEEVEAPAPRLPKVGSWWDIKAPRTAYFPHMSGVGWTVSPDEARCMDREHFHWQDGVKVLSANDKAVTVLLATREGRLIEHVIKVPTVHFARLFKDGVWQDEA